MKDSPEDIASLLGEMKPKDKAPRNRSVLDSWISKAEQNIDSNNPGRLAWLVSTTISAAKLQSVLGQNGISRFGLKGGTLLQHRLGLEARATRDLDGIIRGDIDDFIKSFDESLLEDWGPIAFQRSEVEIINVPSKVIKPRRFDLLLMIRGQTWRKVAIEISPDEGHATESFDLLPAPALEPFGIPSPDHLVGMALGYQIAQKYHAATDPHDPPVFINQRARDVVDLVLLKRLSEEVGEPSDSVIREAIKDIFDSRAEDAKALGRPVRELPAKIVAYPHWQIDYAEAASSSSVSLGMEDAIRLVNKWIDRILFL